MQQYDLTKGTYEYELNHSLKKGKDTSKWLKDKYNTSVPDIMLYHFTKQYNVPKILRWGIFIGDVMTGRL
jgi:hypothetical protein